MIFGGSKVKVVFIDEFDGMTQDAQGALRALIEQYSDHGRFVLTANYEHKISDAIISRMQTFRFKILPKNYILDYAKYILEAEKIEYQEDVIKKIVSTHHPDVRKIIGILQSRCQNSSLSVDMSDIESNEYKCRSLITDIIKAVSEKKNEVVNKTVSTIQQILSNYELDYNTLYEGIGNDPNIPIWVKIVVSRYYDKHVSAASPQLNCMAMVGSIIMAGIECRNIT
jgi:DNA polymerase III delta prime subunit